MLALHQELSGDISGWFDLAGFLILLVQLFNSLFGVHHLQGMGEKEVYRDTCVRSRQKDRPPSCAHLVEEISELFLSLDNLLPVFYLLVFDVLLLQPEHTQMPDWDLDWDTGHFIHLF